MKRGEIWWASLPAPRGSEPGYKRPVLIVQNDEFSRSRINTVVVAGITSNLALRDAPGNVLIHAQNSGLPKESVVNVSQIVTVDKRFLTESLGTLDRQTMLRVDDGLRLVLSL